MTPTPCCDAAAKVLALTLMPAPASPTVRFLRTVADGLERHAKRRRCRAIIRTVRRDLAQLDPHLRADIGLDEL